MIEQLYCDCRLATAGPRITRPTMERAVPECHSLLCGSA